MTTFRSKEVCLIEARGLINSAPGLFFNVHLYTFVKNFVNMVDSILQALKRKRLEKKIKQVEVSRKIGVTQTFLSLVENGKKEPRLAHLRKYAEAIDVPIEIIVWESITEDKVPEHKKEVFRTLKPAMDELIKECEF